MSRPWSSPARTRRVRVRMTQVMTEIRGERAPSGYWDYRTMRRVTD